MKINIRNMTRLVSLLVTVLFLIALVPVADYTTSKITDTHQVPSSKLEYTEVIPPEPEWVYAYNGLPSSDNHFNDVYQLNNGRLAAVGGQMTTYSGHDPAWDWFSVNTPQDGGGSNDGQLWTDYYGGTDSDRAMAVTQANDSDDTVVAGYYMSLSRDFRIRRLDSDGNHIWTRDWTKDYHQVPYEIVTCSSGGYAVAGYTVRSASAPPDFYLLRVENNGIWQWDKWYGYSAAEEAYSLIECSNGDFVMVGYTRSLDGSDTDVWIVRVNSTGGEIWNQVVTGDFDETAYEVAECSDGGFAIIGATLRNGNRDLLLIRTDSVGNVLWDKVYGGTSPDEGNSLVACDAGGFAITGTTESYGSGNGDVWLLRTDNSGELLWSNQWGGSGEDTGQSIIEGLDGGFIIAGGSHTWGGGDEDAFLMKVHDPPVWLVEPEDQIVQHGSYLSLALEATATYIDTWRLNDTENFDIDQNGLVTSTSLLPVGEYGLQIWVNDTLGNTLTATFDVFVVYQPSTHVLDPVWERTFGAIGDETLKEVITCSDGGFVLVGRTSSYGSGDNDGWLVRTDEFGNILWNKTFGGADDDRFSSLVECPNGDFLIVGTTTSGLSYYQAWMVRTDYQGNLVWSDLYGSGYNDAFNHIIQASDGNYVTVGRWQPSYGDSDLYIQKVYGNGTNIWSHKPADSDGDQEGIEITECTGGYALAGYTETADGVLYRDAWIYKVNTAGSYQWDNTHDYNSEKDEFWSIIEQSNGEFICTGFETEDTDMHNIVFNYNSAGTQIGFEQYLDAPGDQYGSSVIEISGGEYAVVGTTQDGDFEGGLYRLNSSGGVFTEHWEWTYGGAMDDYGIDIALCPDGGYIIAGYTDDGDYDAWLFRVQPVKWTEIPVDQFVEDTATIDYFLEVDSISGSTLTWILNDTVDFNLDDNESNATLSLNGQPSIDIYGLEINVTDDNDDFIRTIIQLTVEPEQDPEWVEPLENQIHEYGELYTYQIQATDTSGIVLWELTDESYFSISPYGLVYNNSNTPIGLYALEVTLTDGIGRDSIDQYNIEVVDTTAPAWNTPPVNQEVYYGTYEVLDISATDLSGVDTYWLNDSTYFVITGSLTLAERSPLPVGIHHLQINVNDSIGNIQSANVRFRVTIDPPQWIDDIDVLTTEFAQPLDRAILAYAPGTWGNWWLNDTQFAINDLGVLTNATILDVGKYSLHVWASDIWGQTIDTAFQVSVLDWTAPIFTDPPSNITVESGDQFEFMMSASDASEISHWTVNNTDLFSMTGGGRLVNIEHLDPGTYGVTITVNDIYYNFVSVSFDIFVTDTGAPTWIEEPIDRIAELGRDFNYQLQAQDFSGIGAWWLFHTVYFSIDSTGLITNSTPLVLGEYEVAAFVSDNLGNIRNANFTVTVSDNTGPAWLSTPYNQGLEFGSTLEIQFEAWDLSSVAGWEVDDTQYFSITTAGLLTSSEKLLVGTHEVTVTVYDSFGNSNSFTFYVAVRSNVAVQVSIPLAITIILEIMGGVFVILACVFVMAKRHGVTELPDIGDGLTGHFLRLLRLHHIFGGGDYKI